MKNIKFIAVPFGLGTSSEGIDKGYEKYKEDIFCECVLDVSKFKKDFSDKKMKNLKAVISMVKELSNETFRIVKNNDIPIIIGGDHSVALGSISGVSKHIDNLGVVWVDAHGDMNTDLTTPSGNIHGMVLAALQGVGNEKLTSLVDNKILTKNVAVFGTRDLDKDEKEIMDNLRTKYYPYSSIETNGLLESLLELKKEIANVKKLHLSIDLDSINPIYAPGVSVPVNSGFSPNDIIFIIDFFFENFEIVSVDIVEYNPLVDKDDKTLSVMKNIIWHLIKKF